MKRLNLVKRWREVRIYDFAAGDREKRVVPCSFIESPTANRRPRSRCKLRILHFNPCKMFIIQFSYEITVKTQIITIFKLNALHFTTSWRKNQNQKRDHPFYKSDIWFKIGHFSWFKNYLNENTFFKNIFSVLSRIESAILFAWVKRLDQLKFENRCRSNVNEFQKDESGRSLKRQFRA